MSEKNILNQTMASMSAKGFKIFRNNTGMAWQGNRIPFRDGILLKNARPVKFGLCEGSSDLIGWKPYTITPNDVGKTIAIFTAIEIKSSKKIKITEKQKNFIQAVIRDGGIGEIIVYDDQEKNRF